MTCNNCHTHSHSNNAELSFEEKLAKILNHWVVHNNEHNESYKKWSAEAKERGYNDISALIEEAEKISVEITKRFEKAANLIK